MQQLDSDVTTARGRPHRDEAAETTGVRDREATLDRAPTAADRTAQRLALLQRVTSALSAAASPPDVAAEALLLEAARAFDPEERAFLLGIAEQCAQALDRARLLEAEREALAEARRATYRLAALQAVTSALASARTADDVATVFAEGARAVLGAEAAAVYSHDREAGAATLLAHRGLTDAEVASHGAVPLDAPHPAAAVIRSGEACWLESWDEILAAFPDLDDPERPGDGAIALVPLRCHLGVLGAGALYFHSAHRFDGPTRVLLESVAEQCGQALERALLLSRERALRLAAEHDRAILDGIFQNAPFGICLLDRTLRYVRVNPVLARMNGAPADAHLGRAPPEIIPELAWDEIAKGLRQVVETGVPRLDVPVCFPGPGGQDRHFLEAQYPVRVGGETVGLGAIVRDVTAERDAEEFQRHVLAIVGHDLRTPLTTIATAASLLERGEPLTHRQARLVARVTAGAGRIERVVGLLVDYAQARAGRAVPLRRRACDLGALCRSVADEGEAARPGRVVRCAGAGDATGDWDPDRLCQALGNLVSNALDYSHPDTPIEVSWRAGPEEVDVEVANEGRPIPPELLPRLFEPFERGERDQPGRRGLGLGLFIARAIAEAHGGGVAVRSDDARTVFTIRLPRAPAPCA